MNNRKKKFPKNASAPSPMSFNQSQSVNSMGYSFGRVGAFVYAASRARSTT